jgi:hypothetical protein
MTTTPTEPGAPARHDLNLRALLTDAENPGRRLLAPGTVDAVLGSVPAIGDESRRMLTDGLAGVAESLLEVDLGASALAGWTAHERLVEAARATRDSPGLTEIVDLTSHDVTSVWRPAVEVLLGPAQVARIAVELSVTLRMVGVFAAVTGGRLTRIGGGRCDVVARLAMSGRTLLERTVPVSAEAFSVAVGRGVDLVPAAASAAVPAAVPGNGTGARP